MKPTDTFNYTTKFGTTYYDCCFVVALYNNGNLYLGIVNDEEGEICTCSVNGERVTMADEIGIKNYSENEGMVDFLVGIGIIKPTPIEVEHSGWIDIPYFKLTESGKELVNESLDATI